MFRRYVERLTRLARSRLSPRLAARTDPEDVVLSAYRSFFVGARAGRFSIARSGDLWRLLVSIVLHKLYRQVRHHGSAVRSVTAEQRWSEIAEEYLARDREPAPDEALALAEELQVVLAKLDPFARRVLELRLQGVDLATIAAETDRSERTVRRALQEIRGHFAERFEHG